MEKIWANRLVAGSKDWEDVPASRKEAVLAELEARVEAGVISKRKLAEILGEPYEEESSEEVIGD